MLVKCDITVTVAPATQVSFKNRVPFPKCITKMLVTTTDDAEDLNIVMSMYNLIEYGSDYSEAASFMLKMRQLILIMILKTLINLNLLSIRLNY